MDARWNHKLRKSVSATKYVMCVWHSKNCGQLHIPLPGIPENTARKIPRNRCPPSSRHNTLKIIKISKMYRKPLPFGGPVGSQFVTFFHTFFQEVGQSAPRVPKWRPRIPQWSPKVTPNPQKAAQMYSKGDKMDPRVPQRSPKDYFKGTKMDPRVLQRSPKDEKTEPQGHPKC